MNRQEIKGGAGHLSMARQRCYKIAMEKPPIRKDYFVAECGCRQWYESVPGGPVEVLEEVVEYCEIHDIESGSA